ncbi:MAG: 50S ribosomal protein L21 [Planctomycetota bacterium]|jgi:large subunit ribosomal protein L21
MYAVIEDRGNQIKVAEGEIIEVDLMDAEAGAEVVFDKVLLYSDESDVKVGKPAIDGAKVVAEVLGDAKGRKIYGVSFRRRKGSKVRKGHRQHYSRIRIKQIAV